MNKDEFRTLRENRGYTQASLAVRLGYTARHIRRYESGEWPVPVTVEMAMRVIPRANKRKRVRQ